MNKFGVVLGIAAVATLAGCKNHNYNKNKSDYVDETPAPITIEPTAPKCTCAPGTKHSKPCTCGAPDCKCVVETKPVIVADVSKKPVEPEYTIYVVQNGDYLAKISKKFNVTISSIKRLNPSIKENGVIRVGQKLKLPGKVDVPPPAVASGAASGTVAATAAKKSAAKKSFAPYTGATKEYVVKNGDTLGSIAYGNGINIRQLKELNGLSSDSLKIGQKLKIPAEKVVKAAPAKAAKAAAPVAKKESAEAAAPAKAEAAAPAPAEAAKPAEAAAVAAPAEPAKDAAPVAEAEKAAAPAKAEAPATTTYVVQEGDDMTGVSIRWGVSAAEIRELNNLAETDQLVPGQIIKLPADAQQ